VNFGSFNYSDAHDGDVELTTMVEEKTTKTKNDNVNIHKQAANTSVKKTK